MELMDDDRLMIEISDSQPLIPKPYGETALLQFLETNFDRARPNEFPSRSKEDEAMGGRLYKEFADWRDVSLEEKEQAASLPFQRQVRPCLQTANYLI